MSTSEYEQLSRPAGDPDGVDQVASSLRIGSQEIDIVHTDAAGRAASVQEMWMSEGGEAFGRMATTTSRVLSHIPPQLAAAHDALTIYATALRQAQQDLDKAQHTLDLAHQTHDRIVVAAQRQLDDDLRTAAALGTAGNTTAQQHLLDDAHTQRQRITDADTDLQRAQRAAHKIEHEVEVGVESAAQYAMRELGTGAADMQGSIGVVLDDLVDKGDSYALGLQVGLTGKETALLAKTAYEVRTGKLGAVLDEANEEELEKFSGGIMRSLEDDGDIKALKAAIDELNDSVLKRRIMALIHSLDGADSPAEWDSTMAEILGLAGKAGLAWAVITDGDRLFRHHEDLGDRIAAGVNLGALVDSGELGGEGLTFIAERLGLVTGEGTSLAVAPEVDAAIVAGTIAYSERTKLESLFNAIFGTSDPKTYLYDGPTPPDPTKDPTGPVSV